MDERQIYNKTTAAPIPSWGHKILQRDRALDERHGGVPKSGFGREAIAGVIRYVIGKVGHQPIQVLGNLKIAGKEDYGQPSAYLSRGSRS